MKYDNKSITVAGAELLSEDIANKQSTVIEQMVVSDKQPADLSDIPHLTLNDFADALYFPVPIIHHQDNTFQPSGLITNNNVVVTDANKSLLTNVQTVNNQQVGTLAQNYDIQMVGIVGHTEGQNNNTLVAIAIANPGEAFTIPASTDIPYQLFFDIAVGYSNASNVIVNVNNAGYVTQSDLLNALQTYVSINNAEVITGDKNFTGKLQHNGVDVIDSNELNEAISNFSGDDKNHNFIDDLQYKGVEVATTNDTNNAYQNAVNTAKAYTDGKPDYVLTKNEVDAINLANNATKPTLYVYPDAEDINAISLAKHVNGIYGYGVGNLQPVDWNVTNDNPSNFQFNNVSVTYNPNDKQFTLHGNITTLNNGNANDNVLTLNISQLGLNEITSNSLNNQPVDVDTDTFRKNVIMSTNANYTSGSTISVDGDTINLGYDASLKPKVDGRIFGVSWNQGQSSTLTRTDASVGLQAGVNGAQNDFDKVSVWAQMHRVTDNLGNVFVRIPKFYIKKTQTSGLSTWQVSLTQIDSSWYLPKCFWNFSTNQELPYVDVGAYEGSTINNALASRTQQSVTVNTTIGQFRQLAKANGNGYQQYDIHVLDALQVLFIVEFATLDSSQVVGNGTQNGNYNHQNTGMTDSLTASTAITSDTNFFVYRGIENLYGNYYKFVDGIGFNNDQIWVCDDANNYADSTFTSPYNQVGYNLPNNSNWIQSQGFDQNHPEVSLPQTNTGTQGYYQDYVWSNNGNNYCLRTGGDYLAYSNYGLFHACCDDSFSFSYSYLAGRLIRKPL